MKIIAGTGHRPSKLGGYTLPNKIYVHICNETQKLILNERPDKIICGMALGFDQWLANVCIKLGIPFIAAVPFEGQEKIWPEKSKKAYYALLNKACEKVVISSGGYSAHKLQIRNEWMVDRSDILLAVWNQSPGGTANCINYAKSKNKQIIYINPHLDA